MKNSFLHRAYRTALSAVKISNYHRSGLAICTVLEPPPTLTALAPRVVGERRVRACGRADVCLFSLRHMQEQREEVSSPLSEGVCVQGCVRSALRSSYTLSLRKQRVCVRVYRKEFAGGQLRLESAASSLYVPQGKPPSSPRSRRAKVHSCPHTPPPPPPA